MGILLVSVACFMVAWAVFEFFAMLIGFDDYGDNAAVSLTITIVFAMLIGGVQLMNDDEDEVPTEQATQIDNQWPEEVVDDLIADVKKDIEDKLALDVDEEDEEELITVEPEVQKTQTVPANKAHIESTRRHYDSTVIYVPIAREACNTEGCFTVNLIQHTDGSFWACKRNYGACYEYDE